MPITGNYKVEIENLVMKRIQTKLKKIGAKVVKRAKELVPVDTGKLKKSIHAEVSQGRVEIIADAKIEGEKSKSYAYFVETGEGRGPAQPFLRPALHGLQDEINEILNR